MNNMLREFKRDAKKHLKGYTTFLRGLPLRKIKGLQSKIKSFHKEAYAATDCGQCANCCKTMSPTYTKADVKRISKHTGLSKEAYWKKYLEKDEEGDIVNRKKPCHFLDKKNRCTIYEIRPLDCRRYPHTQRKDFVFQRDVHIQNISECPIVFHVVKKLNEMVIKSK